MRLGAKGWLSAEEEAALEQRIARVERKTSAEVRIHVERRCPGDVMDRAAECFEALKMHQTAARNGVLLYLALKDRKFAVLGDIGIHQHVGDTFWKSVEFAAKPHLVESEWSKALDAATAAVGDALAEHFPWTPEDVNELTNAISWGW